MGFNIFHILGDVSHTTSKGILMWAIHSNSSAEGVSLITQVLYALVFCTRYLDIFHSNISSDWEHVWNFTLKIFYIVSSFYIIFLMSNVYARTREREKAWKFGLYCLFGSVVLAPIWFLIFKKWVRGGSGFEKILWVFSEILESVCIIPQLLLLRQTAVPTVLDSFYLVTLGTYRFLYILNWITRGAVEDNYADPTSWVWGTIQTALMIDFAWVYWTRQRVKLRHGGIVDSDDLRSGWIVGRFLGRKSLDFDEDRDEESAGARARAPAHSAAPNKNKNNGWGSRGISVSADEGVLEAETRSSRNKASGSSQDPEAQPLADPAAFEDESEDEDTSAGAVKGSSSKAPEPVHESGVSGGDEWNDDVDDDARERR